MSNCIILANIISKTITPVLHCLQSAVRTCIYINTLHIKHHSRMTFCVNIVFHIDLTYVGLCKYIIMDEYLFGDLTLSSGKKGRRSSLNSTRSLFVFMTFSLHSFNIRLLPSDSVSELRDRTGKLVGWWWKHCCLLCRLQTHRRPAWK